MAGTSLASSYNNKLASWVISLYQVEGALAVSLCGFFLVERGIPKLENCPYFSPAYNVYIPLQATKDVEYLFLATRH